MSTTTRSVITITLTIAGDPQDAMTVVDNLLDNGEIQELINRNDLEVGDLEVLAAECGFAEEP